MDAGTPSEASARNNGLNSAQPVETTKASLNRNYNFLMNSMQDWLI